MGEVRQAIKRVSDIVGEIAAASEEQSRNIEQVSKAIRQMDDVTQQNAALVEQAAAASQSLEEQAGKLRNAVSVFQLSELTPVAHIPTGTFARTSQRSATADAVERARSKTAARRRPNSGTAPSIADGTEWEAF